MIKFLFPDLRQRVIEKVSERRFCFLFQDFFRHLPHWIQQHTAMNDAGNFLIETCDETISRDLKQQLLLLNGRWRELFMQVKQVCGFAVVTFKNLLCHFHASKTDLLH